MSYGSAGTPRFSELYGSLSDQDVKIRHPEIQLVIHAIPPKDGYTEGSEPGLGPGLECVLHLTDALNNAKSFNNDSRFDESYIMSVAGANAALDTMTFTEAEFDKHVYDLPFTKQFGSTKKDASEPKGAMILQFLKFFDKDVMYTGLDPFQTNDACMADIKAMLSVSGIGTSNVRKIGGRGKGNGVDNVFGGVVNSKDYWGGPSGEFGNLVFKKKTRHYEKDTPMEIYYTSKFDSPHVKCGETYALTCHVIDAGIKNSKGDPLLKWHLTPTILEKDFIVSPDMRPNFTIPVGRLIEFVHPIRTNDQMIHVKEPNTQFSAEYTTERKVCMLIEPTAILTV